MEEQKKGIKKDEGKLPLGIMLQRQFPKALNKIATCTKYGNEKYKETDKDFTNFRNVENGKDRYLNALYRHLAEAGDNLDNKDSETGLEHLHHAAWNILALIEVIELDYKKQSTWDYKYIKGYTTYPPYFKFDIHPVKINDLLNERKTPE